MSARVDQMFRVGDWVALREGHPFAPHEFRIHSIKYLELTTPSEGPDRDGSYPTCSGGFVWACAAEGGLGFPEGDLVYAEPPYRGEGGLARLVNEVLDGLSDETPDSR